MKQAFREKPQQAKTFSAQKATKLDYEIGDTVRHIKFGVGIVKMCIRDRVVAAAEETGDDLVGGRGDAYCGVLNASYNLKLRNPVSYTHLDVYKRQRWNSAFVTHFPRWTVWAQCMLW